LRGLHYQNFPHAQTKLVRVLSGIILDVAVDLRKNKNTFGKVFSVQMSDHNKKQLLVPKGFAHGFLVLSEYAEILYKCDEVHHPESEGGIMYNDPALNIDWGFPLDQAILSGRDQNHQDFANAEFNFGAS
jgi:dTDP-4-dehydrorhamnose 3,5-epimerase